MKNLVTSLLFVLAFAAAHTGLAQTIRRVNNSGLTIAGVNIYTTLQAAHDAASAGDIIYLEPTNISYGDLVCVRTLTIIGNGYFLTQNPGLQLDTRNSIVGTINFNAGSTGSRITGCEIAGTMGVSASSVTVERNYMSGMYVGYNTATGARATVSNIIIRQNYFTSVLYLYPNGTTNTVSNVNITNNIIRAGISAQGQYIGLNNILISNNVLGDLVGNYTGVLLDVDNSVIKNNVLTYTGTNNIFTQRNNVTSYNISGNNQLGTASGNKQNSPSDIFVGGTASTDGAFQLRTSSPASGAGDNGTDIGAYGGAIPYRIAGIPNVPSIYQFNQTVSGNSLNATISTRSNN